MKARICDLGHATDDPDFVRAVLGLSPYPSNEAKVCANRLELKRRLAYWIGLLRHRDAGIRIAARDRVTSLTNIQVPTPSVDPALDQHFASLTGIPLTAELECAWFFGWYEKNRDNLVWRDDPGRYVIMK